MLSMNSYKMERKKILVILLYKEKMLNLEKTPSKILSKKLVHLKYAQLILNDLQWNPDIRNINEKTKYILQSYIIHLVAVWQCFIEDLLRYGLARISQNNTNPQLTQILKNHADKKIKRFNTPNTTNIDIIFKEVLNIDKVTDFIDFDWKTAKDIKKQIDDILEIRHKIAHTADSKKSLNIKDNFGLMEILFKSAESLEHIVCQKL